MANEKNKRRLEETDGIDRQEIHPTRLEETAKRQEEETTWRDNWKRLLDETAKKDQRKSHPKDQRKKYCKTRGRDDGKRLDSQKTRRRDNWKRWPKNKIKRQPTVVWDNQKTREDRKGRPTGRDIRKTSGKDNQKMRRRNWSGWFKRERMVGAKIYGENTKASYEIRTSRRHKQPANMSMYCILGRHKGLQGVYKFLQLFSRQVNK